jgi:hypothetical protein
VKKYYMKLKQIEEIATRQVPIWQPALLVVLLLAGFFAVPLMTKPTPPVEKKSTAGMTLGVDTIKETLDSGVKNIAKPLAAQLQKEVGVVLGLAQEAVQQTAQNVASKSAEQAKEFVFDNTIGKLLQNINSLPADQQDLIKKAICK